MPFEPVYVYDGQGNLLGASIKETGAKKLHTANLWTDTPEDRADFTAQLARLQDNVDVRAFWPDVRDPEVQALLDDPEFEKLKLSPVEVVDEENSVFIWDEDPRPEEGFPGIMNRELSVVAHKSVMAPAPADVQRRVKKACEVVARRRAQEAA